MLVWDADSLRVLHAFGGGFYSAGLAVLFFSPDDALVVAVGMDTDHSLGVWRLDEGGGGGALRLGEKKAETLDRAAVYGGCWMERKRPPREPGEDDAAYEARCGRSEDRDTFATVGYGKHVKFWELQQPDEALDEYQAESANAVWDQDNLSLIHI